MKLIKIGNVQMVTYTFSPDLFWPNQIKHHLLFNRLLEVDDLQPLIAEFGKEILAIKNIRAISRQMDEKSHEEWVQAESAYKEICTLWSQVKEYSEVPDKIELGNTTIKIMKPRVMEFKE